MENIFFYDFEVGKISIREYENKITKITINEDFDTTDFKINETDLIKKAYIQLKEYFNKERKVFDLPLDLNGSEFQKKVWNELLKIPYGETISYKELAIRVGNHKASRAVGNANNKNKHIIIVPCHRVIGSDGKLVGYGGGLELKRYLIDLEKDNLNDSSIRAR